MAIAFSCPSCGRGYRVKEALAGKTAECGRCGNRMKVPRPAAAELAPLELAPLKASPLKSAPLPSSAGAGASWMDEELAATPPPAAPASKEVTCPGCGATQPRGATLCGSCGADVPDGSARSATKPMAASYNAPPPKQKPSRHVTFDFELGATGSLIRGTLLSMVFALVGAALWAVVAIFSMSEFGIIAWGLGGLAGFGMALGHEDEDNTVGGIIAAFVSLFGIMAAKVLMVVVFIMAAVADGELDEELVVEQDITLVSVQRELLAGMIADRTLDRQGLTIDVATEAQNEQELATARARVAKMSDDKVTEAFLLSAEMKPEDLTADPGAVPDAMWVDVAGPPVAPMAGSGFIALFFQTMFRPIDGLFILLAFFTAYKVGSGKMTD